MQCLDIVENNEKACKKEHCSSILRGHMIQYNYSIDNLKEPDDYVKS